MRRVVLEFAAGLILLAESFFPCSAEFLDLLLRLTLVDYPCVGIHLDLGEWG